MKNQYFGDVNDYIKYGLLRALSNGGKVSLSVCWMLTLNDGRNDGKFTDYLQKPEKWRKFDPTLFDQLREHFDNSSYRNISVIESSPLLPNTRFNNNLLTDDAIERQRYFEKFLEFSKSVVIVFFDPDNGLEVKSKRCGNKGSNKYLYWNELVATTKAGHSALIYQHYPREKHKPYITRISGMIRERTCLENVIAFPTPRMVFFLAVQEKHKMNLSDPWNISSGDSVLVWPKWPNHLNNQLAKRYKN